MSEPAVIIRFAVEAAPRVLVDARDEGEYRRLADWIEEHEEYVALIHAAMRLEEEARAA